jgi:hypothetical protein
MSAKQRWVMAIVGLLVANVIAMTVLTLIAHSASQSKVVPGYTGVEKR